MYVYLSAFQFKASGVTWLVTLNLKQINLNAGIYLLKNIHRARDGLLKIEITEWGHDCNDGGWCELSVSEMQRYRNFVGTIRVSSMSYRNIDDTRIVPQVVCVCLCHQCSHKMRQKGIMVKDQKCIFIKNIMLF